MSNYGKGPFKPGKSPYPGHSSMCADIVNSEHGTGTSVGKLKVTEGRLISSPVGNGGSNKKAPKKGRAY